MKENKKVNPTPSTEKAPSVNKIDVKEFIEQNPELIKKAGECKSK